MKNKKLIILFVILIGFFSQTVRAGDFESYHDTNELMRDDDFYNFVENYFGNRKSNYLYKNGLLARHIIGVLHGPPDDIIHIEKNIIFGSACRAHSCDEKGAVVFNTKTMDAIFGMIHYLGQDGEHIAAGDPGTLLIIFKNKNFKKKYQHLIVNWAKKQKEISKIDFMQISYE